MRTRSWKMSVTLSDCAKESIRAVSRPRPPTLRTASCAQELYRQTSVTLSDCEQSQGSPTFQALVPVSL